MKDILPAASKTILHAKMGGYWLGLSKKGF